MMSATTYHQILHYKVRPSTATPTDPFWVPSPDHLVLLKFHAHEIFGCCYGCPPSSLDLRDLKIARKVEKRGAMAMAVPLGALLDITSEDNSTHLETLTSNFSDMGVPDHCHGSIIADACHLVESLLYDSATPPPAIVIKAKSLTLQFGEDDRDFGDFERVVADWDYDFDSFVTMDLGESIVFVSSHNI